MVGLLLSVVIYAQVHFLPIDEKTGKVTYMEVIEAPSMTATETFRVMSNWAKEKGFEVVATEGQTGDFKSLIKVNYPNASKTSTDEATITFTANLMAKDGRYRYIFTDFVHSSKVCNGGDMAIDALPCGPSKISVAGWAKAKKETNERMTILVEDLKKTVKEAANDPSKNNDW